MVENGKSTIRCPMAQQDSDITPAILLQHMQGMERRLREDFRAEIGLAKGDLQTQMSALKIELFRKIEYEVTRAKDQLTVQIDGVDQRMDAVESEYLPKRVTRLEKAVGVGQ